MEFGMSTTVVKTRMDPDYVDRYRAVGMTCLEIGARPVFIDPEDREQQAILREHFEKTGTRAHSIHAPFQNRLTIAHEDAEVREEAIRSARVAARVIVALGGDVVVVHPGDVTREVADMDAYMSRVYDHLPRIVDAIVSEGARVAFENLLPERMPDHPDVLMALVERFPSELVGVCIDTGHAHCTQWKTEFIRRAASRIITTHIQDCDGQNDQHLMPGYGSINWDSYMQAFYEAGYAGPWIFEVGKAGEAALEQAADAMNLLRGAWEQAMADDRATSGSSQTVIPDG